MRTEFSPSQENVSLEKDIRCVLLQIKVLTHGCNPSPQERGTWGQTEWMLGGVSRPITITSDLGAHYLPQYLLIAESGGLATS